MGALREWCHRLWATLRRNPADRELEEELRLHLDLAEQEARSRGFAPADAARLSRVGAGGVAQTMEALRDQRSFPWLDDLLRDGRYGLRTLRRNPVFAATALLTLAVGIGANTAVFSVVDGVLVKPLPYPDADRLIAITHTAPGAPGLVSLLGDLRLSASMYFTYADENRTFQAFGVWVGGGGAAVTGIGEPEQVRTLVVSDGALQALGVAPAAGRLLSAVDQVPGGPERIMISYGYWKDRFDGDPSIVGRGLIVDGRPREIVGVTARGFRIADTGGDLVLPFAFDRRQVRLPGFGFRAVARLKPGMTIADASADIARMIPIWNRSWPAAPTVDPRIYEGWRIAPAPRPLKDEVVGNIRSALWVLMGTIAIVLLIACANVANLMLVRAEGRQQELAVRAALGAGPRRIMRQLLIESVLLGVLGGAVGLALAYGGLRALVATGPATLPRMSDIGIDTRALAFTVLASLASGVLFGIVPALKFRRRHASALQRFGRATTDSRERHHVRNGLVVAQVALALVLLVSAGLMMRTARALRSVDPGFSRPDQVETMRMAIPQSLVSDPERVARMQHDITERLAAIPGVDAVGFASIMYMEGGTNWDAIRAETKTYGPQEMAPFRYFKSISPGLFRATGTRIAAGRDVTWTDLFDRRRVVIVSENLARELWGSPSAAIGKRIQTLPSSPWHEVIGVVQDVYDNGVHQPAPAIVYWPAYSGNVYFASAPPTVSRVVTFAIRSRRTGTEAFLNEVRRAVWSTNASVPVAAIRAMQDIYEQSMARTSFTLVMLTIAGSMALLLGLVGIYGVISYAVSHRTREIGIRVALGAEQQVLRRMFVGHALRLAGTGVVIGLAAARGLTRLMSSLLYGTSPMDPATFVAMPIVLAAAAALASWVPARRAASVDPVEALKAE